MCGRYQAWLDDDELLGIIEREKKGSAEKYFRRAEVFPGDEIPIIYGSYAAVRAHRAIWGFPAPSSTDDAQQNFAGTQMKSAKRLIINARAETAMYKPMFRQSFETGRALVLASGYYEWSGKQRWRYFDERGAILMAAFERVFEDERRYVILTTPAIGAPSKIHDRMPVFVDREEMKDWLYDESYAKDVLTRKRVCTLSAEVC